MKGQAYLILDRHILSLLPADFLPCQQIPCRLKVPAGRTIRETLESLGLRLPTAILPLVNGSTHDLSYCLQDCDEVRLIIQLSGGCV